MMPTATALPMLTTSVNVLYDRFLIVITHRCLCGSRDGQLDLLSNPR
jgi:hypothetical protein